MLLHKIKNQNFSSFVRVCFLNVRRKLFNVSLDDDPLKMLLFLVMRAFFFFLNDSSIPLFQKLSTFLR